MISDEANQTTLTLTDSYGSYTITINKIDNTLGTVVQELVKPVLLAAGYHPDSVSDYLEEV